MFDWLDDSIIDLELIRFELKRAAEWVKIEFRLESQALPVDHIGHNSTLGLWNQENSLPIII